jgi:hypothetical protein
VNDTVEIRVEVRWRDKVGMRIHRVIPSSLRLCAESLEKVVAYGAAHEAQTIFCAMARENEYEV